MKGKLENLDIEFKAKLQAVGRLRQALAKKQSYIDELNNLRDAANRLVAKGHDKAALIVRELDTKLEKLSARADNISFNLVRLRRSGGFPPTDT